jgi:hypothetical protein
MHILLLVGNTTTASKSSDEQSDELIDADATVH